MPIYLWVEVPEKGVSKNDSVLPQGGDIEALEFVSVPFDNVEPAEVHELSFFIFCPINIVYHDWGGKFLVPNSKSFPGFFIYEVICGTAVNKCFLICL